MKNDLFAKPSDLIFVIVTQCNVSYGWGRTNGSSRSDLMSTKECVDEASTPDRAVTIEQCLAVGESEAVNWSRTFRRHASEFLREFLRRLHQLCFPSASRLRVTVSSVFL